MKAASAIDATEKWKLWKAFVEAVLKAAAVISWCCRKMKGFESYCRNESSFWKHLKAIAEKWRLFEAFERFESFYRSESSCYDCLMGLTKRNKWSFQKLSEISKASKEISAKHWKKEASEGAKMRSGYFWGRIVKKVRKKLSVASQVKKESFNK